MDENAEPIATEGVDYTEMTADIICAYVSNNPVPAADMPVLIASTHAAFVELGKDSGAAAPAIRNLTPAQVRKSITHDALISFEDGKSYKTLRRHLSIRGLSPEEYREKWGLSSDYPMTAASYSEKRSKLALVLGLGNRRRKAAPKAAEPASTVSKKAKRPAAEDQGR